MTTIAMETAAQAAAILRREAGVAAEYASIGRLLGVEVPELQQDRIVEQYPPSDYGFPEQYPAVYVYCDRVTNRMSEKGRRFSGTARLVIECRMSQDRAEGLESRVRLLAEAVARTVEAGRGQWNDGMFQSGAYEIQYGPAKRGGKHLAQSAKITLDVDVSGD
jgi:hypothetical protein